MYVEINEVTYDEAKQEVIFCCTDLDKLIFDDWSQEFPENTEVTYRFDLSSKGPRIYLYKLIRSQVKADYSSLKEGLFKLTNKITTISTNFLDKN